MTGAEPAWTCPACSGTFPLEERWVHKPKCPGKANASVEPPTPSPSAWLSGPKLDMERLRSRILASVLDASRSANPRDYLVALVLRAAEEQGLPETSEAEASQIVRELARREPRIARVLEKVVG